MDIMELDEAQGNHMAASNKGRSRTESPSHFWAKVRTGGGEECWPYVGCRNAKGYGIVSIRKKHTLAHRRAWQLARGPIPDGKMVLHACDNPPCCNPQHLRIGNARDNVTDMLVRGRHRPARLIGERHPQAKLGQVVADQIRAQYASGITIPNLARMHAISDTTILEIVQGKRWGTEIVHPPVRDCATCAEKFVPRRCTQRFCGQNCRLGVPL